MKAKFSKLNFCISALMFLALIVGLAMPMQKASADTTVLVYNLQPSWTAIGGGGVFSAYVGPTAYGYVSPGSTAVYNGIEAGIIKAGLAVDPTSGNYEDEGLFAFIPNVTINVFAAGTLTYDVDTQAGVNPVWMTIEIDTGVVGDRTDNTTYQFVPTTNPADWHLVDAAAGLWQKWNNNNGDVTGNPKIPLSDLVTAHTGLNVIRAYLRLGMGNSYNNGGTGTIAWVDQTTLGGVKYDFVASTLSVTTTDPTVFCGTDDVTVSIDISQVGNLFGYQFQVNYAPSKVTAAGAFDNSFFDTTGGSIPWNAVCDDTAGVCKFSVSKVETIPPTPVSPVSGSGRVATVTFTGIAPGAFSVTMSNVILSDRDANVIGHVVGDPLNLTVCGLATISGVVKLQGRATPIDAGTVTFTDGTTFPDPVVATFDAGSGIYSAIVKYLPGGTNYKIDAAHGLYLGNQIAAQLVTGNLALADTKLLGGDANNSGGINVDDLTCVAGAFGLAPVVCGTTGSSDINADATTNILDLVLVGGNYGLATPRTW